MRFLQIYLFLIYGKLSTADFLRGTSRFEYTEMPIRLVLKDIATQIAVVMIIFLLSTTHIQLGMQTGAVN